MKKPKFCNRCGQKLIRTRVYGFNQQTGKPNYANHCPMYYKREWWGSDFLGYDLGHD